MNKTFFLSMVLMTAVLPMAFLSCDGNGNDGADSSLTPVGYSFTLKIDPGKNSDYIDLIDVTYIVNDSTGKEIVREKVDFSDKGYFEYVSPVMSFPDSGKVVVTENISKDAVLDKPSYRVGMNMELSVSVLTVDDSIYNLVHNGSASSMTISAENIVKLYPKTRVLAYNVFSADSVTISYERATTIE